MDFSKFEKAKQILSSILVGDICREIPFEFSAAKIYLDDMAKEMQEAFSDKNSMLSLIKDISPSEDLMVNMAYGLAYFISTSAGADDAVNIFYDRYCSFIDSIVLEYAGDDVKNDKDVLRTVLELYCDRRKYIHPYYKDVYELPGLCYAVPHELLMDDEIFKMVLLIANPGEVYNELLTAEEKLDKGIVCRLLEKLNYNDFCYYSHFKECFRNLCENVPRDILMDKDVREQFFKSGFPSMIYKEVLTDKERLDDEIIFELLKTYEQVSFPGYKNDYLKLKELWAEALVYDFRDNEYAGDALEMIEPGADKEFRWIMESFFDSIGDDSCECINDEMQAFMRRLSQKDLKHRTEWKQHKEDAITKVLDGEEAPELWYALMSQSKSESPYCDAAKFELKRYMYQFKLFDKAAAGDFSFFTGNDNGGNTKKEKENLPTGCDDGLPFA